MKTRKCFGSTCGAEIAFVDYENAQGNKTKLPIDPPPIAAPRDLRGHVCEDADGVFRTAQDGDTGPFYLRHHASCPDRDQFKRNRRKDAQH